MHFNWVVVGVCLLSGCGRRELPLCESIAESESIALERGTACPKVQIRLLAPKTCDATLPSCSETERRALGDDAQCLRAVAPCRSGFEGAYGDALVGCLQRLSTPPERSCVP
jgi:hypothetical protein